MKQELTEENRKALVEYRIERAEQTLSEAKYMLKGNFYNAAINRLYYACFYAAEALLLKNKISARTHAGVKTMLGLHFVSKKLLSTKAGQIFITLFNLRHSGDYDDFVYCDKDLVEEYIPKAESFINEIKYLLATDEDKT